jgi:hypothetical protein
MTSQLLYLAVMVAEQTGTVMFFTFVLRLFLCFGLYIYVHTIVHTTIAAAGKGAGTGCEKLQHKQAERKNDSRFHDWCLEVLNLANTT